MINMIDGHLLFIATLNGVEWFLRYYSKGMCRNQEVFQECNPYYNNHGKLDIE